MKTVLVTGVAGFIGSNLTQALLKEGNRVVGIDNFDDTYDPNLKEIHIAKSIENPNFVLHRIDIRNLSSLGDVFKIEKPSHVIHLAAKADTRSAVKNPYIYTAVNIEGTLNILELCREYGIQNLVIASSSSVYGNNSKIPLTETEVADRPLSPYGATKRTKELLAYTYHHNFGMNITCLRYFNAYGENNRPDMVPYIWTDHLLHDEEIKISGDGSRKRDYTHVSDTVRATILAMNKPLGFEIINIGNNAPVSLRELLSVFEKVIGIKAKVKSRPSHPASVEITYANIDKAKELLDWEPQITLQDGIADLVEWFRANRFKERE